MATQMTKSQVRRFLLNYAWLGTSEEQARQIDCILAQDNWCYLDARADQYAGAQFESGPAAYAEGFGSALTELYECHSEPHLPTCPNALKEIV